MATVLALALLSPAGTAASFDGGMAARSNDGGALAGDRRLRPPVVRAFSVSPGTVRRDRAVRFVARVSGPGRGLRAFVELRRGRRVVRVSLGRLRSGRHTVRAWRGLRRLKAGAYAARLVVRVRTGERARSAGRTHRTLRVVDPPKPRPRPAPSADPSPPGPGTTAGRFPVAGPHVFPPGPGGEFGNDRGTHLHQGVDIAAAEGLPVVAPVAGAVVVHGYQAGGAGHYVVVRGDRDYVFMHLQDGSTAVSVGQRVSAGQRLGNVGSTGRSSGPHLHFEIWVGPWQAGGRPIDPAPDLRRWGG